MRPVHARLLEILREGTPSRDAATHTALELAGSRTTREGCAIAHAREMLCTNLLQMRERFAPAFWTERSLDHHCSSPPTTAAVACETKCCRQRVPAQLLPFVGCGVVADKWWHSLCAACGEVVGTPTASE